MFSIRHSNDIIVFFSEEETTPSYKYYFQGMIGCLHKSLKDFYDTNSGNNQVIIPVKGTKQYKKLDAQFAIYANMTEEELIKSRAKPADEYSIVISYDSSMDMYAIKIPKVIGGINAESNHINLDKAFKRATIIKASLLIEDIASPWNIFPRKASNMWKALEQKIDIENIGDKNYTFKSMLEDIKSFADNKTTIDDIISKNKRILSFIKNKSFINGGIIDKPTVEYNIYNYIKVVYNMELKLTTYVLNNLPVYMHPDIGVKLYSYATKSSGYMIVTPDMLKTHALTCDLCNNSFIKKNLMHMSETKLNGLYCKDCIEERGYALCQNGCDGFHHEDEICAVYAKTRPMHIWGYSKDVRSLIPKMQRMPTDKKVNGEHLYYGVELEVLPKDIDKRDISLHNCGKAIFNRAIIKSDSSLGQYGFEIVTSPATLEFHKKSMWHDFFNTKYLDGLTAAQTVHSWDTKVCGIHVHITRAALTDMQLSKMLVFYHEPNNSEFLSRIAGRKVGMDAHYCQTRKNKLGIYTKDGCNGHHGAITISSRNRGKTAEVRIFRGNSTYHGIIRAVEFVDATAKWCGVNAGKDVLDYAKFLEWFNRPEIKGQYPELKKHLLHLKYLTPRIKNAMFQHLDIVPDDLRTA